MAERTVVAAQPGHTLLVFSGGIVERYPVIAWSVDPWANPTTYPIGLEVHPRPDGERPRTEALLHPSGIVDDLNGEGAFITGGEEDWLEECRAKVEKAERRKALAEARKIVAEADQT